MADKVQSIAQFVKSEKEKKEFASTKCGLWFDYKQKTLSMRSLEEKAFWKTKYDSSWAILVWKEIRNSKYEDVEGLAYYYCDTVIDKYSSQDNLQIVVVITILKSEN